MKVCAMIDVLLALLQYYFPFVCTVKRHVCEPTGLIDRTASDMPCVNQEVG